MPRPVQKEGLILTCLILNDPEAISVNSVIFLNAIKGILLRVQSLKGQGHRLLSPRLSGFLVYFSDLRVSFSKLLDPSSYSILTDSRT